MKFGKEVERPHFCKADAYGSQPLEMFSLEKQKDRLKISASVDLQDAVKEMLDDVPEWLPLAADAYNISPDLEDYILSPVVSMPSDLPNKNGQAFPYHQLSAWVPNHGTVMYKTWKGKGSYIEHCFPGDAPIRTKNGYKQIKNIKVGDKVLTHLKQFKKVKKLFNNGVQNLHSIKCDGLPEPIIVTDKHPIWVVDRRQTFNSASYYQNKIQYVENRTNLTWNDLKPHWRPLTDVYKGDYLIVPIIMGGNISVTPEFAFLTGVFMAEGNLCWHKHKPYTARITINRREDLLRKKIIECCEALSFKYSIYWDRKKNCCTINVRSPAFALKMYDITGEYAHKKSMRGELRKWNSESLKWFIGGYICGDGHTKAGYTRCRTTSKRLATDIWQTLSFLGYRSFINKDGKPRDYFYLDKENIQRHMNSKESYTIKIYDKDAHTLNKYLVAKQIKQIDHSIAPDILLKSGYVLVPIASIIYNVRKEKTFNIEVEDHNSYVAYNVAVHNCSDDWTKAKGIIFASMLMPIKNTSGNIWKVVKLVGIDRNRDSVLANDILSKKRRHWSMGAYAEDYECSVCGAHYSEGDCEHLVARADVAPKFQIFDNMLAYWNVVNPVGFEISSVAKPAFSSAEDTSYFTFTR